MRKYNIEPNNAPNCAVSQTTGMTSDRYLADCVHKYQIDTDSTFTVSAYTSREDIYEPKSKS